MLNRKLNGKFECIKEQINGSNFMKLGKVYDIKNGTWIMEDGKEAHTHATTVKEFNCYYNTQIKGYRVSLNVLELEENRRYKDKYDIEYEFENGNLYVLTCSGRTESLRSFNTTIKMKFTEVEIDKRYKPKYGEIYFVPSITRVNDDYRCYTWVDNEADNRRFNKNIVRKQKQEAVDLALEMLECANIE